VDVTEGLCAVDDEDGVGAVVEEEVAMEADCDSWLLMVRM
jgi:hypothetical protein